MISGLMRLEKKTETGGISLYVEGIDTPVYLTRNRRARRIILRINESRREVHLTIPDQCNKTAALEFLERNHGWLKSRLDKLPKPVPFHHGSVIPFRGVSHHIIHVERNPDKEVVRICHAGASVEKPGLYVSGGERYAPRRLKDWFKKQAREDLIVRVDYHADRLKLAPKRISVRDQKSRWGSCSSEGALSFSWRLVLAPEHVLDYVAAHEVAHLAEMNHGPNFWKLVKQTMPDYERSQSWLTAYGGELHRYGENE